MPINSPSLKPPVALIVGPTASGKSALALELAEKQPSVIINADSAQVYRDLQLLSARPSAQEMDDIPHKLYGYIDGAEACSAARWAQDATAQIEKAHDAGNLPILVGGTGLYVRTLLDGIAPIPDIDPEIRADIRAMEAARAADFLAAEDPIAAQRLHARDESRVKRALEVVRSTGKSLDYWHAHRQGGIIDSIHLAPLILLPPREWLYARCDKRFRIMVEEGAVEEVEALRARQLPSDCPVMRAIGVPEISAWLEGTMDRESAIAAAQTSTRQYAKRQYTWFRNQLPTGWPRHGEIINDSNDSVIDIIFHVLQLT